MKKILSISIAAAIAMGFSACQEEEFGFTARQINYETEFVKTFGTPDANHTWNTLRDVTIQFDQANAGKYFLYVTTQRPGMTNNVLLDSRLCNLEAGTQNYTFSVPRNLERAYFSVIPANGSEGETQAVLLSQDQATPIYDGQTLTANASQFNPEQLTGIQAYIAFEDLGGTCDWDFNDVVIKVTSATQYLDENDWDEPNTTRFYLDVELLAIGGTLPVYLETDNTTTEELHNLFGKEDTNYRFNVTPGSGDDASLFKTHDPVSFRMDPDMSASDERPAKSLKDLLSDLSLVVKGTDQGVTMIKAGSDTTVPQALVIVTANNATWAWPKEGQNIGDVYEYFKDWVNDKNYNWYDYGFSLASETDPNAIPEGDGETPTEAQAPKR